MTKIRSTDASRIQDRRGQGGGGGGLSFPGLGGGGGGMGIPMKAGGGILGLIVVLAALFLPRLLGGSQQALDDTGIAPEPGPGDGDDVVQCETELEQILCGGVDDVSDYWIAEYPQAFGGQYREADTVFFTGATNTGCGQASAQIGPFYCPADELVYFDLDFLTQLQNQFGATGDLAAQYIVAHEYGHHVQNVLGVSSEVSRLQQQNPVTANRYSVALELQADCFAGAWAQRRRAPRPARPRARSARRSTPPPRSATTASSSRPAARVNPDSFTHGTSEQRVSWFRRGFETGDPRQCNTFDEV